MKMKHIYRAFAITGFVMAIAVFTFARRAPRRQEIVVPQYYIGQLVLDRKDGEYQNTLYLIRAKDITEAEQISRRVVPHMCKFYNGIVSKRWKNNPRVILIPFDGAYDKNSFK
jgi:hypothetical protein